MSGQRLAPHEAMETHELLVFKTTCCTKSATMQPLVSDKRLRFLLQNDVKTSQAHIRDLQAMLSLGVPQA